MARRRRDPPGADGLLTVEDYHALLKRRPKYGATRTEVNGYTFDSRAEAGRYVQLTYRQQAGELQHLTRQVSYSLAVNGVYLGTYRCDFRYYDVLLGAWVVEDVKSPATLTKLSQLKIRLMLALHGITVAIVDAETCYGML